MLIICYIIPHFFESFRWDRVFQEKGIFNYNCSEHMSVVIFILHYEKDRKAACHMNNYLYLNIADASTYFVPVQMGTD